MTAAGALEHLLSRATDPVSERLEASGNRIAKKAAGVIDALVDLSVAVVEEALPFAHVREVQNAFELGREVGRAETSADAAAPPFDKALKTHGSHRLTVV